MRVLVKDSKRTIRFWLPTSLIFSNITAEIASRTMSQYVSEPCVNLSAVQLRALFAEFRRIKRQYGSWILVDVQSSEGQTVNIIL